MPERPTDERIAALETEIIYLRDDIAALLPQVKELTTAMNKRKGAFAFAMLAAGGAGGALIKLLTMVSTKWGAS